MKKVGLLLLLLIGSVSSVVAQWADISIPGYFYTKDVHFLGQHGFALAGAQSLGTSAEFCKTDDYGANWTVTTPDYQSIISPQGVDDWSDYSDIPNDLTFTFTGEAIHFFNEKEGLMSLTVLVEIASTISGESFSRTIKTVDGGETWTEVQQTELSTGFTQFVGFGESGVIVNRHGDILRSEDKGETWTQIFDYSMGYNFDIENIEIGPDGLWYAGVHFSDDTGAVMRSDDMGASWEEVFDSHPTTKYRYDMAFAPNGDVIALSSEFGGPSPAQYTYLSTDNGESWQASGMGLRSVVFANGHWYGLSGSSVFRSLDGLTWEQVFSSPENKSISELSIYNNAAYVCGWHGLVFTNHDPLLVSIDELESFSLSVYPNPTSDILTIDSQKEIQLLELYSYDGQLVDRFDQKNITLTAYPAGFYLLKATFIDGLQESTRIIKK